MKAEIPSSAVTSPDIRVWMNLPDAAASLSMAQAELDCLCEVGAFDTRVQPDGSRQVEVSLPQQSVSKPTLMPLGGSTLPMQADDSYRARRSAKRAWTAAAAMLVVATGSAIVTASVLVGAHDRIDKLSTSLHEASDKLQQSTETLQAESDKVDTLLEEADESGKKLAAAQETIKERDAELVVERNVEDTLFKAALANRAAQAKSSAMADISR